MKNSRLIKKFNFDSSFQAPTRLTYQDLVAKPLTRADVKADMGAVNSSLDIIRQTRGGTWPSELVSEEFNFLDLAWHEREFRDGDSFAYAVYGTQGTYIGCFYLYPIGARTELSESTQDYEIDASWWVTQWAYDDGYYPKLYAALKEWLTNFPTDKILFSNQEMPG